jgi:hypothetical protein
LTDTVSGAGGEALVFVMAWPDVVQDVVRERE